MSNILIIKHGAFGDIIQALGIMEDIAMHHGGNVDILTHPTYAPLFETLPWVNQIILDDRKALNLNHFKNLFKTLHHTKYKMVYDLQNSTRSTLYRWLFFRHLPFISNRTMLKHGETKKTLDNKNIFFSFDLMLKRAGIPSQCCRKPNIQDLQDFDFNACKNIKPYVFIAPFCSAHNPQKKWPHFKALIEQLTSDFPDVSFVVAPGPGELEEAQLYPASITLDHGKPTSLRQLISLIIHANYVITIDTAAAHIASCANKPGTLIMNADKYNRLFLKSDTFRLACEQSNLKDLTLNAVLKVVKSHLNYFVQQTVQS